MSGTFADTLSRLGRGLAGWRFPAGLLGSVILIKLMLLCLVLFPVPETEALRTWCFSFDPATGTYESWVHIALLFIEPVVVAVVVLSVWWAPLSQAWRQSRLQFLRPLSVSLALVTTLAGCLSMYAEAPDTTELPFPAEAIRTSRMAPPIELIDQLGQPFSLEEQRGKVVVLTAIYATCGHTCPIILTQAKAALADLPETDDLVFAAVTMDAANDTPEVLLRLSEMQDLPAPTWRLLTGDLDTVEGVLDRMDVSRERDEETGVISHANLFLVVDREGRIAYSFTLGERQQSWLTTALRMLLEE